MISAVLFDKDGTLVDFHRTWVPAVARAARLVGRERADELLALGGVEARDGTLAPDSPIACGTTREVVEGWARHLGDADAASMEAAVEALFEREVRARPVAVAGLAGALDALGARGAVLGVATMDTEHGARVTLERLRIAERFAFVTGCDSGHGLKPGPGMVEAFCAEVGIPASAVAVVGDTRHDCEMGRSAGAGLVVGVAGGASGGAALEGHCDALIGSVAELGALLDARLPGAPG